MIKPLRVSRSHKAPSCKTANTKPTVIARQALAQEEAGDFNSDFPETIPIKLENDRDGCAC